MTSGWQGARYFRRYGGELVSKPAISLKEKLGGGVYYRGTIHFTSPFGLQGAAAPDGSKGLSLEVL